MALAGAVFSANANAKLELDSRLISKQSSGRGEYMMPIDTDILRRSRLDLLGRKGLMAAAVVALGVGAASQLWLGSSSWVRSDMNSGIVRIASAWGTPSASNHGAGGGWLFRTAATGVDVALGQVFVGQQVSLRAADGVEHVLDVVDVKPIGADLLPLPSPSAAPLLLVTLKPAGHHLGQVGAASNEDGSHRVVRLIVEAEPMTPGPAGSHSSTASNKAL